MIKRLFVAWLMVAMCIPQYSYAQALPSAMQRAVSGVIQAKMVKRGFAANDPRYASTVTSVGSQIVGASAAAAVVTMVGVTAPAWVTVGATVALGAVFAAGISIAADKTINWLFNSDGTVNNGNTAVPTGTQATIEIRTTNPPMDTIVSNSIGKPYIVITHTAPNYYTTYWYSQTTQTNPDASKYSFNQGWTYQSKYYYVYKSTTVTTSTPCPQNYTLNGSQCVAQGQPVPVSVTDAVNALTPEQLSKSADPEVVSRVAQAAWEKAAAQPGYQGVPIDAADPITPGDVQAYREANPATWPTVRDVVQPQPLPDGTPAQEGPFSLPAPTAPPAPPEGGSGTGTGTPFDFSIINPNESVTRTEVNASYSPVSFTQTAGCPAAVSYDIWGETHSISFGPVCDWLSSVCAPLTIGIATIAAAFIFARGFKV